MPTRVRAASSLDGRRSREAAEPSKANSTGDDLVSAALRAVTNAPESRCPHAKPGAYAWNQSEDKAIQIPCGSWGCHYCGWQKRQAAAYLIHQGIRQAIHKRQRVRFFTLTEDPRRPFEGVADISAAWNRLRTRLKREEKLSEYVCAVEHTKRGRLHLHVVATGAYIPQRRLSSWAAAAGFGRVADIREVQLSEDPEEGKKASAYVAKELAGYVSKGAQETARENAKRRRPLRCSRGWWKDGGLRAAEERLRELRRDLEAEDTAPEPDSPWWFVWFPNIDQPVRISGKTVGGESFEVVAPVFRKTAEPRRRKTAASGEERAPAERRAARRAADDEAERRAA